MTRRGGHSNPRKTPTLHFDQGSTSFRLQQHLIIRTRKEEEEMNSLSAAKVLSVKPLVRALELLPFER